MRRASVTAWAVLFFALAVLLAGCPRAPAPAGVDDRAAPPGDGADRAALEPASAALGVRDVDPAALGLEVYPGATAEGSGDVEGPVGHLMSINLVSTDDYAQVAEFYRAKYPDAVAEETGGEGSHVLTLEVSPAPDLRTVTVMKRKEADAVAITLLRHRVKQ